MGRRVLELPLDVAPDAAVAAARAASHIAERLRDGLASRGLATLALSGGSSPLPLYAALAEATLDWRHVHVFQVDERVVPRGDPARNLEAIARAFVAGGPLPAANLHAMPVESSDGCAAYAGELARLAGDPPRLDVIQLGLGTDGHTASLFPGDEALAVGGRDVAFTGTLAGYRRMTLTYPALERARALVWFAPGAAKATPIAALVKGDRAIPAGRVARARARAFVDAAAAPRS
ncbi:MAG: 6-phosphogluconolactonase [Gammaproteobacteria bacterium]|nr:6-phosphogluconolactonase [Gammaproteobacteria bacterium]MBI5616002.1 6-phosphogluconolactonase [Gammaproteobacteria bacterium]